VEFGPAPGCDRRGSGQLGRGPEAVVDEVRHGAECHSVERCEPLSNGCYELAAVFDEAGECDPTQVGVALDPGLDVASDLGVDLVEQRGECAKHPEVTVDVRAVAVL
jgi:hypothetical protein